MISDFIADPVFGVTLTLAAYFIGIIVYKKTGSMYLHPMLVALVLIAAFLLLTGIEYDTYNRGGELITFLLGPATVALAIPMHKHQKLLKKNAVVILAGTAAGAVAGVLLVLLLGLLTGAGHLFKISVISKSVTTPIAVGITDRLGGAASLTVVFTILHGLVGGIFGPRLLDLLRVRSRLARGLTMGMLSHGLGTARALEESEMEGALAGLAIGLMGFFTALAAPLLIQLIP